MVDTSAALRRLTRSFADVIPVIDERAEHDRWKPGIGPFEEEEQLRMILEEVDAQSSAIGSEVPYPDVGQRCDIDLEVDGTRIPIEAKLLRFRLDNGNIDPNMYKSVFSPFPERSSSSLLTDARKLSASGFTPPYGLLGLYYEENDEEYDLLSAENIADKFSKDVEYWFDLDIEIVEIARSGGLRHPHHQHGAVISWMIQ